MYKPSRHPRVDTGGGGDRRHDQDKRPGDREFTIKAWDEQPFADAEGAPKLTQASISTTYTGDLEGEGTSRLLMLYDQADATYSGYERISGSLDGRSGSFVLRLEGGFQDGAARTSWTVAEGTATGVLTGLQGEGGYVANQGEPEVTYELRWSR